MVPSLAIDGSYGEGGGAVLRNALSLSAVLGEPIRIENIRVKRPKPGLQAQHLTAVRALAQICRAKVEGAELGSLALTFQPQSSPQSGQYSWDVAEARKGGSAGATSLIFQGLLVPLHFARGQSRLSLRGGTHVAWSPPFHYLESVYLPTMKQMGVNARVDIERWGWYPIGGGIVTAAINGTGKGEPSMEGLNLTDRGPLKRLSGVSASSNLPSHIAERQKQRAQSVLCAEGFDPQIEIVDAPASGQGTMFFILAEFERVRAGFTSLGRRGRPAEQVAEEACKEFLQYFKSEAALDRHLADQLVLPLALASGASSFSTCEVSQHLLTNVWIVEQLLGRPVAVEGEKGGPGRVSMRGRAHV